MTSNNNHNHNNFSKISQPFNGVRSRSRSRSPDPSPHKRNRFRRHTLPSKFHCHPNFSHPYFSQHSHHLCDSLNDDSIDTSSLNQGVLFYQDPSNGETNFYWEDELETCSPSLMPENTVDGISGDSTELEEKYFRIMAKELSSRKEEEEEEEEEVNLIDLGETPVKVVNLTEDLMNVDDTDVALPPEDFIVPPENDEFDLEDMIKEMNELLSDNNQELEKKEEEEEEEEEEVEEEEEEEEEVEEEEEPPSPLSPRDPEREGPVLSEEEENTEEGVLYRLEHDPEFQDEAGLDDNEESQISDDEDTIIINNKYIHVKDSKPIIFVH